MDKKTFYDLMYKDWFDNCYSHLERKCEDPLFDKVWELAQLKELYTFFYPLGISTDTIASAAEVFSWLHYCFDDDGETSIVIGRAIDKGKISMVERYMSFCETIGVQPDKKRVEDFDIRYSTVFVMRGWHSELNEEKVKQWTLYHRNFELEFESFTAKDFGRNAFEKLYSFKDRFKEYRRMCEETGEHSSLDEKWKVVDYHLETQNMIEKMIEELQ